MGKWTRIVKTCLLATELGVSDKLESVFFPPLQTMRLNMVDMSRNWLRLIADGTLTCSESILIFCQQIVTTEKVRLREAKGLFNSGLMRMETFVHMSKFGLHAQRGLLSKILFKICA